jgi:hypothetical protein
VLHLRYGVLKPEEPEELKLVKAEISLASQMGALG